MLENIIKVNILGTEYNIIKTNGTKDVRISENDGSCGYYDRTIVIETNIFNHCTQDNVEDIRKERFNIIMRHEIIHAFFLESGLQGYCENEQLVDWINRQFPKILKVFQELNCI